jgi:hypothetical protein
MHANVPSKPDDVPAKCLACGRVFRHPHDEYVCPHCSSPAVAPLVFLHTTSVLAAIHCVLAWELEIFIAGVHFLAGRKINVAGHVVLMTASVLLTLFAYFKGKREIAKVRALGGRAAMTWPQAFLVVLALLVFVAMLMLFLRWQIG